ncbi:FecR family protein [Sphingopyxis fribergensis]
MTHAANDEVSLALEERAAEWCWRIADGMLSEPEREAFDAWIRADGRHQKAFDEMVTAWEGTDAIAEMPGFLSLRAKALTMMETAREGSGKRPGPWSGRRNRPLAAVAAMLLMMIVGGLWYLVSGPDLYRTGIGERQVVRLDDGSTISLDASSEVAVSYSADKRALTLNRGRAKFTVAKDPLRPFVVAAGQRSVVATGTAFSVELLKGQMRVLLYEGHVAVLPPPRSGRSPASVEASEGRSIGNQLVPGQELVANLASGSATIMPVDTERSLSWEGGRLIFVDEPLASAVERVNRYSDIPIIIGDAAAGRQLVNGVFDAGDTRSFVAGVTALFPIAERRQNGGTLLVSKTGERDNK